MRRYATGNAVSFELTFGGWLGLCRRARACWPALLPLLFGCVPPVPPHDASATPLETILGGTAAAFAQADSARPLAFPEDHGPHPAFRSEWWYFTGNLSDAGNRPFGFELAFFRFALTPDAEPRASAWAAREAWMAHFAVTDVQGGEFLAEERFARGALGLAGAIADPFRAWVLDWQAAAGNAGMETVRLDAKGDAAGLELRLTEPKPPVAHGDRGLDKKGPAPGEASYYYSMPRWEARGVIRIGDREHSVSGTAWLDREWSSGPLNPALAGWDWFGLQLDDGRELMLYRLRLRNGQASPYSSGTLVDAAGRATPLTTADFTLTPLEYWRSPATGARYPVAWRIELPSEGLLLDVQPQLDDQELDVSVRYWEGAVTVEGTSEAGPLGGRGYLELTGY